MKRALTILAMLFFVGGSLAANNTDIFSYDQDQVATEMSELEALENYVIENGVTYDELEAQNSELVTNVSARPGGFFAEPPLGIPSFIWGFCLTWVGILVVYLITESKDETMKALWGCIASGVLSAIFYIIYVIALGLSF